MGFRPGILWCLYGLKKRKEEYPHVEGKSQKRPETDQWRYD